MAKEVLDLSSDLEGMKIQCYDDDLVNKTLRRKLHALLVTWSMNSTVQRILRIYMYLGSISTCFGENGAKVAPRDTTLNKMPTGLVSWRGSSRSPPKTSFCLAMNGTIPYSCHM